jgi:uncharacterized protein YfaA (DUF2138 family)
LDDRLVGASLNALEKR